MLAIKLLGGGGGGGGGTCCHFSSVGRRLRSQLHMAGAFITFNDCLVLVSPMKKGGKNDIDRIAFTESVPVHLNILRKSCEKDNW